jgi:hypothetical protein
VIKNGKVTIKKVKSKILSSLILKKQEIEKPIL